MRRIVFELTGVLGNQAFEKGTVIKDEGERLFKALVSKIEDVSGCKVLNDEFIVDIQDSPWICEEDKIEKDLTYELKLEEGVYSTLTRDGIINIIDEIARDIENGLHLAVVDPSREYAYEIISDSMLFNEIEFVNTICPNIHYDEIDKLTFAVAGFDYTEDALNIEDVMSDGYKKLTKEEIMKYSAKMVEVLENPEEMKYYELSFYHKNPTEKSLELFGEGGYTVYFKSDLDLENDEVLNQCLKQWKKSPGYLDLVEAVPYLDGIYEITKEEFYKSAF